MKWFVTFKPNTSHYQKVLVFTDMARHIAWDLAVKHYGKKVDSIYSEQEFATILPHKYECTDQWFVFMEDVTLTDEEQKVSVKSITDWFRTAKPEPVIGFPDKWLPTQLGAHFEEFAELVQVFASNYLDIELQEHMNSLLIQLNSVKTYLYKKDKLPKLNQSERIAVLDALADQVVTATGVAYFSKFKFDEALTEVNKSNYSKFVQGKPVLNEHGKIIKGKDYFKPELKDYV